MVNSLLINIAVLILAALGCLTIGAIMLNNPPLYDAPGFLTRMKTYLTKNTAEMRRGHEFPELELRRYQVAPARLYGYLEQAIRLLGWEVIEADAEQYRIHAVVETSLFKFKDDIEIRLQVAEDGTELHIRSQSRVGSGDFGANTRHILNLLETLMRVA